MLKFETGVECGHDVTRSRLFVAGAAVYLFGLSRAVGTVKPDLVANFSCQIVVNWAISSERSL